MTDWLAVAIGGALGACARYGVGLAARAMLGAAFPWGTLVVNVIGSFAMGMAFVVLAQRGLDRFAPLVMTGTLGGFTTFSAFSLDAYALFAGGRALGAGAYVGASVVLSIAALVAGIAAARSVVGG